MGLFVKARDKVRHRTYEVELPENAGSFVYDTLALERGAPQNLALVLPAGLTNHPVSWDTLYSAPSGDLLAWDDGDPTHVSVLADALVSATLTVFITDQPDDWATVVWIAVIGGTSRDLQEMGPAQASPYQPGGNQFLSVTATQFKVEAGDTLIFTAGADRGASDDSTLVFAELVVSAIGLPG